MREILCMLLVSVMIRTSFAARIVSVNHGERVKVTIAAKDLTQIIVRNDAITAVRGITDRYHIESDDAHGRIFVKPNANYQHHPFTLFITTKNNHSYTLYLTPKYQSGDTIILENRHQSDLVKRQTTIHESEILALITAMLSGKALSDYEIEWLSPQKLNTQGTVMQLKAIYHGKYLQGQIYQIINKTGKAILLDTKSYATKDSLAVGMLNNTLRPNEMSFMYKVKGYE